MAAPDFVPTNLAQQPRRGLAIPPAEPWHAERPSDLGAVQPVGDLMGYPGPDQGYGLLLARRFAGKLVGQTAGEHEEDAIAGCFGVALKRASLFGRAPVIHDFTVAFTIWGFLGEAPDELVALRKPLFQAAGHHYWERRAIVDHVPETTLRQTPAQVSDRFPAQWRELLGLP